MTTTDAARRVQAARRAIAAAGGLVGAQQIANEWGVSRQAINDRVQRGTFPEPVATVGKTALYLRDQLTRSGR